MKHWMVMNEWMYYLYWKVSGNIHELTVNKYLIHQEGIPIKEWWDVPVEIADVRALTGHPIVSKHEMTLKQANECRSDYEICLTLVNL